MGSAIFRVRQHAALRPAPSSRRSARDLGFGRYRSPRLWPSRERTCKGSADGPRELRQAMIRTTGSRAMSHNYPKAAGEVTSCFFLIALQLAHERRQASAAFALQRSASGSIAPRQTLGRIVVDDDIVVFQPMAQFMGARSWPRMTHLNLAHGYEAVFQVGR